MTQIEIHLPPEILDILFGYFDDDDIVRCSSVNCLWYEVAKSNLERRSSLHLCRWPDALPVNADAVCLVGDETIRRFPSGVYKHLKTLKLWYDEPGQLPFGLLERIFKCTNELSRLDILNLSVMMKQDIECILERCTPGMKIKLSFANDDTSKQEVLCLLEEHRELFEEVVVEFPATKRAIGWHPIRSSQSHFRPSQSYNSVTLTSPGLTRFDCISLYHLKSLKLEKCLSLNEKSLRALSQLNLHSLSLDSCTAKDYTWVSSFKTGFHHLQSYSSTNNQIITDDTIKAISTKNIQHLTLDFRKGPSETVGMSHLHQLDLVTLRVITNKLSTNVLLEGVRSHWSKLKVLEVEEYLLRNDDNCTIKTIKSYLARKQNVKFHHKIIYTKLQDDVVIKTVN